MGSLSQSIIENFSGKILFDYVWWVLREAQKRRIATLYFLARDGYLLREIADCLCRQFGLAISCRYLYCSRASVRMPSYYLIGEEAYRLLTVGGYHITLRSLLRRAELMPDEREAVYRDMGLCNVDETRILQRNEFEKIRNQLLDSEVFRSYVVEKSKAAYPNAIGYFRQEGLLDQTELAIVDSGWAGSMQRSIRQLLSADGFKGHITGFYFGLYRAPQETADGTFLSWYFDEKGRTAYKVPFCNNLFECLLSAPHGMTTTYALQKGRYIPVMPSNHTEQQLLFIQEHIRSVLEYTERRVKTINFQSFQEQICRKETYQVVKRYMGRPTLEEVHLLGQFLFCDDITEDYQLKLADSSQIEALKGYRILPRVMHRLLKRPAKKATPELLWPNGTIAYLPFWKRTWYRLNLYVWNWLRYTLF